MKPFPKILIANRGEIAVRITRTARKMGISTVAVYSPEERDALHVRVADESMELRGSSLSETYLNSNQIIDIARRTGAAAIHPGYGFMSENETFAAGCEEAGIVFIGPRSETIALMGNKTRARDIAANSGLPVIRGYTGTAGELLSKAGEIKFPVLIKAAAGGGGKGMRIADSKDSLHDNIMAASREAQSYFGNSSIYMEEYIVASRHIEVQILGDNFGNVIHLFERECSIQRRYQKIIEECPSPAISPQLRAEICNSAVRLAKELSYRNAGTIEFLTDNSGNFYFLEMNTRIQVEHPVTEAVTGIDIVKEQLLIACGNELAFKQEEIEIKGNAIECRIYAEDPSAGFMPSPGKMTCYSEPAGEGVRVDSAFDTEAEVSGKYDPMIAKLITFSDTREQAREKMTKALSDFGIIGIKTNISFLQALIKSDDFAGAAFSTTYCEENLSSIATFEKRVKSDNNWRIPAAGALLASLGRKTGRNRLWDDMGYWRNSDLLKFCFEGEIVEAKTDLLSGTDFNILISNERLTGKYVFENRTVKLILDGETYNIFVSEDEKGQFSVSYSGFEYFFRRFDLLGRRIWFIAGDSEPAGDSAAIYSPMPGKVIKVNKTSGEIVNKDDVLFIIESMKMENSIRAAATGTVGKVNIRAGDLIDGSSPLMFINYGDPG